MPTLEERFLAKFVFVGECWEWIGCVGKNGYGQMRLNGKKESAHRVSYKLFHGEIPNGLMIDHICNNPKCVNPNHLRLCDATQNACNRNKPRTNNSGFKGVSFCKWLKTGMRWRATINIEGKQKSLGYFATPEEAHEAYKYAAKEMHGRFANFGVPRARTSVPDRTGSRTDKG